jgi:ATP-dependent DNA helicase RecG
MTEQAWPPALAKKLAKLGLRSRFDLVVHLPVRYEDETRLTLPSRAMPGASVLVEARIVRAEVVFRPRRQLVVHAQTSEGPLALRFFNFYGSQLKQFQRAIEDEQPVRAFGEVRSGWFGAEMSHPRYRLAREGEPLAASLTPVYPATEGVSQAMLRKLVDDALEAASLDDTLPPAMLRRYSLADFAGSVRFLHRPPPGADLAMLAERTHPAWQRMKFDELLAQQLSMRRAYRIRKEHSAPALRADGPLLRRFLASLPFRLTRGQCLRGGCRWRLAGLGDGAHRDPRRTASSEVQRVAGAARHPHRLASWRPREGGEEGCAHRHRKR